MGVVIAKAYGLYTIPQAGSKGRDLGFGQMYPGVVRNV